MMYGLIASNMTPSPATAQGQEGDIGLQTLQVKATRQGMEGHSARNEVVRFVGFDCS